MSDNEKDNKFEFIKEQVIVKKRKKIKKVLVPLISTLFLAVLFGLLAAVTFVVAEPRFYKYFHKEEDTRTPVIFPNEQTKKPDITIVPSKSEGNDKSGEDNVDPDKEPDTVYVQESIEADLNDYLNINSEIRSLVHGVNKSLVDITSTFTVTDWLGETVEKSVSTTGLVIYNNTKELLILVSLDRVKGANSLNIVFSEKSIVQAELHDYETEINLAIIAVSIEDIPEFHLNNVQVATLGESNSLLAGYPIIALGNPNGHLRSMEIGYITSRGSWAGITDNRLDLFNTSINSYSSSDGFIINFRGEVIGLITRTLKDTVNPELGTAIGISKIIPIIKNMGNKVPRVYFGIMADDMTETTKKDYEINNGIYINEVKANSPAYKAGMQNGDIILEVNEHIILNTNNFYNTISENQPGDKVKVKIRRISGSTDREIDMEVVLSEKDHK